VNGLHKNKRGWKTLLAFALIGLYVILFWASMSKAIPTGASLTLLTVDTGPTGTPSSRTDPGGTIVTININTVQQNPGWKAYIGNITGSLVLRNADSQSIYEWQLGATALTGNIFISRSGSVNWTPIACANITNVLSEDTILGFSSGSADSLNKTFNYTTHQAMIISGIGTIGANTCRSTATWQNGSAQVVSATSKFQEILLSDQANLVYATFIDQDAWGFDNNATNGRTHDFQAIIGDPKNATDYTYYFYADIS
jgi:hypothetical protein